MSRTCAWALLTLSATMLAVPAWGQVHHWTFDETSGLVAADRACGAGELAGFDNGDDSQWVDGAVNGGLDLGADGFLDNRVLVALDAIGAAGAGFTVSMWINPGEQIRTLGEYQLLATPGDVVGFTIMNYDDGV